VRRLVVIGENGVDERLHDFRRHQQLRPRAAAEMIVRPRCRTACGCTDEAVDALLLPASDESRRNALFRRPLPWRFCARCNEEQ
jgi:hypothetical protein